MNQYNHLLTNLILQAPLLEYMMDLSFENLRGHVLNAREYVRIADL